MNDLIITKKGIELMAKLVAGTHTAEFTKSVTSARGYGSSELEKLDKLEDIRQEVKPASVVKTDNNKVTITAEFNNEAVTTGYYIKTLGLYAKDSDGNEILYGVASDSVNPSYMPAFGGKTATSFKFIQHVVVNNSDNITIVISPDDYPTREEFDVCAETVNSHVHAKVLDGEGIHGLRYYDGRLQVKSIDGTWIEAGGGAGGDGFALKIIFDPAFNGQTYTVTGGDGESYSGTVPAELTAVVKVNKGNTIYTVKASTGGKEYVATIETGYYYGEYPVQLNTFNATIKVNMGNPSAVAQITDAGVSQAASSASEEVEFKVGHTGVYTITAFMNSLSGVQGSTETVTVDEDGKTYEVTVSFRKLVVTSPVGATLSIEKGSYREEVTSSGSNEFYLHEDGTYTVHITDGVEESTGEVTVTGFVTVNYDIAFVHIYGAEWDGQPGTKWSRTDEAENFVDPVPYMAGLSNYGSPFDTLLPWSGMVKSERTGGTMVAIPKFWYKLTANGKGLKVQIADKAVEGYSVSPMHMDRGDGKGERDIAYVGRYHCASDYKSKTGVKPVANVTRANARTSIHNLGANIWQSDLATRFTEWLLYIVEFADWNSQAKIGYGCGNNSGTENMGYTDSMPYHTGTTKNSRTAYGVSTQYRNIEGLWDNVRDWMDGVYYNSSGMNLILNPAKFSDNANGVSAGVPTSGYPSEFNISSAGGFPMFYPKASSGSDSTYSCDYWNYNASYPCLVVGGSYNQYQYYGLFYVGNNAVSYASAGIGCRLLELP